MSYNGSLAQAGRVTKLSIGGIIGASNETTYTPVGECKDASRSGGSWGTEDVSNFDSDKNEEFISTMRNNGEVSLAFNKVPSDAGQLALRAAYDDGLKRRFTIQYPAGQGQTTGEIDTFAALVVSVDMDTKVKSGLGLTIKLKVSGGIVTTPPVPAP
ncbi:MAG TPA: phage tail tube protein [Bryobacteraceae bacterium]